MDNQQQTHSHQRLPICNITTSVSQSSVINNERGALLQEYYGHIFKQLNRAFYRQTARHILLIMERGVGSAPLIAELARRGLAKEHVALTDRCVMFFDARSLLLEDCREALPMILAELQDQPGWILGIEGFARLLGVRGSARSIWTVRLPNLRCNVLGILSPREFQDLAADDVEFLEHFTKIEVHEPSLPDAITLLRKYADGLEQQYQVKIEDDVLRHTATLSANYIFNECLPGKAIKQLARACEELRYQRAELGLVRNQINNDDIIHVISEASGVPEQTLRGVGDTCDYERTLSESILGQAAIVQEVANDLGLIKAGFNDSTKPAAVMMFVGQTGTGKTEMAKALARLYSRSKKVKTYTLGNFVESHSVAGIIGVPPGYVGHDAGGQLINDLNDDPYGVFLLDEADKAHPDVLQPFLNLFDEGWIVDQRGVKAYARHAIFILTTNVGQKMISDMAAKGQSSSEIAERMKEALSQIKHGKANRPVFSPEFLARIQKILIFQPLDKEAIRGITDKLISEMQQNWQSNRGKALQIDKVIIERISQRAHEMNKKSQGKEGGRIIRKLITQQLESSLQRAIAANPEGYYQCQEVVANSQTNDDAVVEVTFR